MTPAELHKAHRRLGLSANGAAKLFRVGSGRTVRGWWSGQRNGRAVDIPGPVVVLTEALIESKSVRNFFGLALDEQITD